MVADIGLACSTVFEILKIWALLSKQAQDIITHFYLHNKIYQLSLLLCKDTWHLEKWNSHHPLQKFNKVTTNPLCAAPCKAATSEHLRVTEMIMGRAPTPSSGRGSLGNSSDLSERSRARSLARDFSNR